VSDPHCWGIFRERAHSPGREYDDSEILTLTGKELEARGFQVTLKSPEEALSSPEPRPVGVFMMCERIAILQRLHAVEARGVPHVNSPRAVLNTYRDRMITQFQEANVPFVPSHFVSTVDGHGVGALPVWVKRMMWWLVDRWLIDPNVIFDPLPSRNNAPLFINKVRTWERRPDNRTPVTNLFLARLV